MYLAHVIYISATANNKYRKHGNSMSDAGNDPKLYSKVRNFYLDWLSNYLEAKHNDDLEIRSLMLAARLPIAEAGQV